MRRRGILGTVIAAACVLALAGTPAADKVGFVLIVHPDNPVASVDDDFLRGAYLKRASRWSDGTTVRPLDLPARFPARDEFTRKVLRKTPAQLRAYWNQQIFSGKGVPPPEADSIEAAISYVLANPGAVGYLPTGAEPGGAKVILLE